MVSAVHLKALHSSPYFSSLDESELATVLQMARPHQAAAGDLLFRQGEAGNSMLLILEGEADVFVTEAMAGEHVVQRLGPGETVGEMAVLTQTPRSASVRAATPIVAIEFDLATLERLTTTHSAAMTHAVMHVARQAGQRLASANEQAARLVRRQVDTARFFIFMVLISCIYIVSSNFLGSLGVSFWSTVVGIVALAFFGALGLRVIKLSVFPPSMYGLTLKGAGRDILTSLGITAVVLLVITGAKAGLISMNPALSGQRVFSGNLAVAFVSGVWPGAVVAEALMYAVHSIFQEFLVRGCMQSSLQEFTKGVYHGRQGLIYSIVISNGFFAVMHVHISLGLAAMIGVIGFLWGWMRSRQTSIWGICLSHILIGLWGFAVLAIQDAF